MLCMFLVPSAFLGCWWNIPSNITQAVQEALDKAYLTEKDLTAVAVTIGPGLSLCLRGNA
ncbi:hypothetical protein JHK85_001773 [Glycine max]|nr:hypothetical protein JHK85_001773 [Glycine max]